MKTDNDSGFEIDEDVKDFLNAQKVDYRLCTSCGGAILLPTKVKPHKPSDYKIDIGTNKLYVSKVQARYIKNINKSMINPYFNYCAI
ncbi:MAG: hypothetical protein KAH86_00735 [Methanosarcinales archaeon]|nr:hypothetical protein [Methanosarcinales archaeon]